MLVFTSRPADEAIENFRARAAIGRNPFAAVPHDIPDVVENAVEPMSPRWVSDCVAGARAFAERAAVAEASGDESEAQRLWMMAYDYCHIARYPVMDTDEKRAAYRLGLEYFDRYLALTPDRERIQLPTRFGDVPIIAYTPTKPAERPVALLAIGGLDVWKEDQALVHAQHFVTAGFTVLCVDMPGTGESLVPTDPALGDKYWDDLLAAIPGLGFDPADISVMGTSFGGYWAARIAHVQHDRVRAAVDHGGGAHFSFTAEWFNNWVERGEFPTGFPEALLTITGSATLEDLARRFDELSLEKSGILDGDCTELLLVNGTEDGTLSVDDMYLLLMRGKPKSVRLYEGLGHMGATPTTSATITEWLAGRAGIA